MLTPIKEIRLRNNFRQADVENKTGIPQPRFSRIERGVAKPTQEEMDKLIKAFGLYDSVTNGDNG